MCRCWKNELLYIANIQITVLDCFIEEHVMSCVVQIQVEKVDILLVSGNLLKWVSTIFMFFCHKKHL